MTSSLPARRLAVVFSVFAMLLTVLTARLVQLSVVDGGALAVLAQRQYEQQRESRPRRGAIVDRHGEPLAITVDARSIYLRPADLPEDDAWPVGRALGFTRADWNDRVSSPSPFVWVRRHASASDVDAVDAAPVPGIGTMPEPRRLYPNGSVAANVIGAAGIDTQGLEGVEKSFDDYLAGQTTRVGLGRDALGRSIVRVKSEDAARDGARVTLTLDLPLQYAAEQELANRVKELDARAGVVVALDPRSGEILAMAQTPSFDPNRVGRSTADERRNRAIHDVYEPGSTLKAVLAAGALSEGIIAPDDRIFCENGSFRIGRRTIHDHDPFGWLTFAEVLQRSSNVGSSKVAAVLGAERYERVLRDFGFGERTAVALAGESPGILRPASRWREIDLATASFGQGIAATPLQVVNAFAAIANGGYLMKPYVVDSVTAPDGRVLHERRPEIARRVLSEDVASRLTSILEGVVRETGTAAGAAIPGVRIAGKTGTSQKIDPESGGYGRGRIASFVGYLPAEDPRVVILVVIDEPKGLPYGGIVAAPVFRSVALEAIERLHIPVRQPLPDEAADLGIVPVAHGTAVERRSGDADSFIGLSLREAVRKARLEGVTIEAVGSGYVVAEERPTPENPLLRLVLDSPKRGGS